MAVDATDDTFEQDVLERSREVPVVVDFWAAWCGPCRALAPVLEQAVAEREGRVELVKVDVDANQLVAARHGIRGIPAVKGFKDGREVAEFVGAQPPHAVAAFLDELTAPPARERFVPRDGWEEVAAALQDADYDQAFELLLARLAEHPEERDEIREAMVGLFGDVDDELASPYRRRLSAALY